ncbi:MAG: pyridoxamine 5'-phosphate oxidase family protein [Spirochaetales bacterium]|nr:pyridoxamine 5'-phosphate oxidase family protein [Spirochaetales bacterium]
MNKEEIHDFIRQNPMLQLATVNDEGHPRTRTVMLHGIENGSVLFHTGNFKTLYNELKADGRIEFSTYNAESFTEVRVSGIAEEIDDDQLRETVINAPGKDYLKPTIALKGKEAIRIFRITDCQALVWTMASNHDYPKTRVSI